MAYEYTDHELQIIAQLAYFNFTDKAVGSLKSMVDMELGSIFRDKDAYIYLKNQVLTTRKFDENSGGAWDSRENATIELMDHLANPENDSFINDDDKNVNWKAISEWKLVDIRDLNGYNGFYAITIETPKGMIVGFRGSESYGDLQTPLDWVISDFALLGNEMTIQQGAAGEYMEYLSEIDKYTGREWVVTGHSLGGNLAEHALITAPENMNVTKGVSFDGPGVSDYYRTVNAHLLGERSSRLVHYQYSFVGGLLLPFGEEERLYIKIKDYAVNLEFFCKLGNFFCFTCSNSILRMNFHAVKGKALNNIKAKSLNKTF